MNQLRALCQRLSLASVALLFAASAVCYAQTPAAAPDKDKSAATTAATTKTSPFDEELARTPAGKTVAKFLTAVNSGDIKQMRAFHESTGGDPENAEKDLGMFERTGGLKPHSLKWTTKTQLVVVVQAKKDDRWLAFTFTLGAEEPHPINSISVRPTEAPPAN